MAEELVCHYKASVSPQVPLDVAPHQVTVCIIFDPLQSMDVFELVIFGGFPFSFIDYCLRLSFFVYHFCFCFACSVST